MAAPAEPATQGRTRGRWADLRTRTLSAVVLGPLVLLCVWWGGAAWEVLLLAGAAGLGVEWAHLCGLGGARGPGVWVPVCFVLAAGLAMSDRWVLAALVPLAAAAGLAWAARQPTAGAGAAYIGLAVVALAWLRTGARGFDTMLFVLLVVWASDIGAYMVGRLAGGPKLAPAISPGKTWSGALGGLVVCAAVGGAAGSVLGAAHPLRAAATAALLGVAAQAGDLLESWIKRRFGVKDSGNWIPGHGGLLDRLDGLMAAAMAAAAAAAALTRVAGQGGALWN